MKSLKKLVGALLVIMLCFSLVACGRWTEEDAKRYVIAVLDASYKQEFSGYMKYTKMSEEEVQAEYDEILGTHLIEEEFSSLGVSEEFKQGLSDVTYSMLKQAKYKVVEVKKEGKGFAVTLVYKPYVQGFQEMRLAVEEEVLSRVDENLARQIASGEITEEAIVQMAGEIYLEVFQARIAAPVYGEEERMILHVKRNDEGAYTVDESELNELGGKMFID